MSQTTITLLKTMLLGGDVYSMGTELEMPSSSIFGNRLSRALAPVQLIDSEVIVPVTKTQFKIIGDITLSVGNYLMRKNDQFIADLEAITEEGPIIFDLDPVGVFKMDQTYTSKLSIAQVNLAMYTSMTKQITFKVLWEDEPVDWAISDISFLSPVTDVDPTPINLGDGLWAISVTAGASVGETVVSFNVTANEVTKQANLQVRITEPAPLVFERFSNDALAPNTSNQVYFTLKQSGLAVTDFTGSHVTVRSPQLPIASYASTVLAGSNPGEYYLSLSTNHTGGPATISFNGVIAGRVYTVDDFVVTVNSAPTTMTVLGDPMVVGVQQDVQFTLTQYQNTIPAGQKPMVGNWTAFTGGTTPVLVDATTGTWKTTATATAEGTVPFIGTFRVEEQASLYQTYPVSGSTTAVAAPILDLDFTQVTTRLDTNLVQFVRFTLADQGVPVADATTNTLSLTTSSVTTYVHSIVLDDAATGAYHFQVATNTTAGNIKVSLKVNHAGNVYTIPDFNVTVAVGG